MRGRFSIGWQSTFCHLKFDQLYSNLFKINNLYSYLFLFYIDDEPVSRRDIKILLRQLEEQNEIIRRLKKQVSDVRILLEKGRFENYAFKEKFIKVRIYIHY